MIPRPLDSGCSGKNNSEEKTKVSALKTALEDLLRARRLQAEAPPLRGETRCRPLPTGIAPLDALLGGGFPPGQVSEIRGPASSGKTGVALALAAHATRRGALAAWVDPQDRFAPASAAAAGVDLTRLLWLRGDARAPRGRTLGASLAAVGTLVGSGLFEVTVFDVAGIPAGELRRLPVATWIRLQRMVEATPQALVLLCFEHLAKGPGGVSLALSAGRPLWSGLPGPGRLLGGLHATARDARPPFRDVDFPLHAVD
jgi:recombination protein RecA